MSRRMCDGCERTDQLERVLCVLCGDVYLFDECRQDRGHADVVQLDLFGGQP